MHNVYWYADEMDPNFFNAGPFETFQEAIADAKENEHEVVFVGTRPANDNSAPVQNVEEYDIEHDINWG